MVKWLFARVDDITSRSCDKLGKLNYVSLYQDVWTCSSMSFDASKSISSSSSNRSEISFQT
jgi:hypothetical protein